MNMLNSFTYEPAAEKTDLTASPIIPCDVIKWRHFQYIQIFWIQLWKLFGSTMTKSNLYYRDLKNSKAHGYLKWRHLMTSQVFIGDVLRTVFSVAGSYIIYMSSWRLHYWDFFRWYQFMLCISMRTNMRCMSPYLCLVILTLHCLHIPRLTPIH
jgi:hypothetical protein